MEARPTDGVLRRHLTPLWVPVLGGMQIVGGIVGLIGVTTQLDLFSPTPIGPLTRTFLTVGAACIGALYLLAIIAGVLLLLRKSRGIYLSRIVQIAQLVQFRLLGLQYVFVTGLGATIGLDTAWHYEVQFFPQSDFQLSFYDGETSSIALNGFAVFFLGFLLSRPGEIYLRSDDSQVAG